VACTSTRSARWPRRAEVSRAALAAALLLRASVSVADAPITVRGDGFEAARSELERGPQSATAVDLRARGFTADSLAAVLDEVPGLHARSTGDGLSPTAVSLRGAPATHVTVALDGVVLNDALGGSVDLSLLPPVLLERADVYRGSAPVRLGLAGLGGAIELHARGVSARPFAQVGTGYGSFLQRRVFGAAGGSYGAVRVFASVSYRGTRGDFAYFDDNSTPRDESDDRPNARRRNNEADSVDALARGCVGPGRTSLCALVTAGTRGRGLPGPGGRPLLEPSLTQARVLGRATLRTVSENGGVAELFVGAGAREDRYRDPRMEAGGARATDTSGANLEVGAQGALTLGPVRVEPAVRLRSERVRAQTLDAGAQNGASRYGLLAGFDARARWRGLEVRPSVGFEAYLDAPGEGATESAAGAGLLSPRVGVRGELGRGFALRATAAQLARAPTLVERYGVGQFLVANPGLRPERAVAGDVGASFDGRLGRVSLHADAVLFARDTQDLIVLVRSGGFALKALNLRHSQTWGAELTGRVSFASRATLTVSYAHTEAVQRAAATSPANGRRVPNTPANDLAVRLEGLTGPLRFYVDFSYVDGVFFDESNQLAAPARALLGAGVSAAIPHARGLECALTLSNLLDQRDGLVRVDTAARELTYRQPIADFTGYPLPGRAFFVALTYRSP
jgi:vitamin B12 transporter